MREKKSIVKVSPEQNRTSGHARLNGLIFKCMHIYSRQAPGSSSTLSPLSCSEVLQVGVGTTTGTF